MTDEQNLIDQLYDQQNELAALKAENERLRIAVEGYYTKMGELQADKAELLEALRDTLYHYDGTPLWLIEKVEQLIAKHETK